MFFCIVGYWNHVFLNHFDLHCLNVHKLIIERHKQQKIIKFAFINSVFHKDKCDL